MSEFDKKLVIVVNKSIEPGVAMNAVSHTVVSLGAQVGLENLNVVDYIDSDGNHYPKISKMPFIVLRASGNKIREMSEALKKMDSHYAVFTDSMTVGTWEEQLERTSQHKQDELVFYAVGAYGGWEDLSEMTKKFSLYR